jgi:alpha-glucosidase
MSLGATTKTAGREQAIGRRLKRYATWLALLLIGAAGTNVTAAPAFAEPGEAVLNSPDGKLTITFRTIASGKTAASGGQLVYEVVFRGQPLIESSAIRLHLKDQKPLGAEVRVLGASGSKVDQTYQLLSGKASTVRDQYNALRLELDETADTARKFAIEARAYDDAVAFRYVVPKQPGLREFRLARELTEFRISKDATAYAQLLPNFQSMYESEYVKLPVSALANQGGVPSTLLVGLPLLMEVPGIGWAAITEADLRGNAAMYLVNPSGAWTGHWFESRLAPDVDDPEVSVVDGLPHQSPWRVIMAATEPGRLIESNVITSLNPESVIKDTAWIHPGKAAWDWWSGSIGPTGNRDFTTAGMKYFVDFAAKSGLEYMLIDAGWSDREDITKMNGRVDIPELVKYAAPKGVKIWIWCHCNAVDRQMDQAFPMFENWGVAGIKIDFMSRDDQKMINFYYRVAEKAAQHHLMVDFHGSTKPTGMERTYPNVMGYEAVLGLEQSKAGTRDNPDHHAMLPFTRMLAGPLDVTPGGFDNVTKAAFQPRNIKPMVTGTRAHQLAMYVVYEAPFQMVSDHPAAYENQPAFEFIKSAPTSWDETRVLQGQPGEFIVLARRHGNEWFLGSLTNWQPRQLEIPLGFLGSDSYTADIYADAADADRNPKNVDIQQQRVDRDTRLKVQLAPGGGYAVRLKPAR